MTDEQLTMDCKVQHIRNGSLYQVTEDYALSHVNGNFEAAVIYKKLGSEQIYVRERDDFLDTFELVSAN